MLGPAGVGVAVITYLDIDGQLLGVGTQDKSEPEAPVVIEGARRPFAYYEVLIGGSTLCSGVNFGELELKNCMIVTPENSNVLDQDILN